MKLFLRLRVLPVMAWMAMWATRAVAAEHGGELFFWKRVIDEALKKIEARGWLGETPFGYTSACTAPSGKLVPRASQYLRPAPDAGRGERVIAVDRGRFSARRMPAIEAARLLDLAGEVARERERKAKVMPGAEFDCCEF